MFSTTTFPFLPGIRASRQNVGFPLWPFTLSLSHIQLNCQQIPSAQTFPPLLSSPVTILGPSQQIKHLCNFLARTNKVCVFCCRGGHHWFPRWEVLYAILYSCPSLPPPKPVLPSTRNRKSKVENSKCIHLVSLNHNSIQRICLFNLQSKIFRFILKHTATQNTVADTQISKSKLL